MKTGDRRETPHLFRRAEVTSAACGGFEVTMEVTGPGAPRGARDLTTSCYLSRLNTHVDRTSCCCCDFWWQYRQPKIQPSIQLAPGCELGRHADAVLMTSPAITTATVTKVTDPEFGFDIAEVFAMALLRDKPFATWADDAEVQQVIGLLNTYPQKSSAPLEDGLVTANTLMRGAGAGDSRSLPLTLTYP